MKRSLFWLSAAAAGYVYMPTAAAAANSETLPIRNADHIETVVVSAPLHQSSEEMAVPVTVITDAELQRRAAGTIGAVLDGSPGLTSGSFGPGVGQPVIRGQNGPRVQVLENGTSSADASSVSADHAVTTEPALAESVEVLRGPATLLYGGGAIGGIVNVIDNRIPNKLPEKTTGALEYRHSSVDDGDTSVVKLDGSAGAIAWHLDGVYREWSNIDVPGYAFDHKTMDTKFSSHDYIANTDGRNHTVTGGASWIFDNGYLGLSVSDMKNRYGIPLDDEAEGDPINGVHIDMEQKRYDAAAELRDLNSVLDTFRWHLTYSDYQHQEIENVGEVGTTFTNKTWENRFELVHREFAGWNGVVGLQLKRSDFAAIGEESFIPESINKAGGLFLLENYHINDWIYEVGLRYDNDNVDPKGDELRSKRFNNVSASGSALYNFNKSWGLGIALSRSQRAPTVEELFSNTTNEPGDLVAHDATHAIEVGDPNLKKETSRNIDLTLHYKGDYAHGYVTVFHNDFSDFIALLDSGLEQDGTPILEYRQEDAKFNGVEFDVTVPLSASKAGAFSLDLYGDRVRGEFAHSGDVPRLPPLRIGTRLNYEFGALTAYAGVLHAAKQDRPGEFGTDTDGYNRVDAGVSYQLKTPGNTGTLLFLRGTNLTNQEIRNSVSLLKDVAPEPGRSLEAGVRFTF